MPAPSILTIDPALSPQRADQLRRVVGVFGLLLVAVTWRLWTPQHVFPQVPLFRLALSLPETAQWLGLTGLLLGLATMVLLPPGRGTRASLVVFAASTAALIVMDQQRLQPWAYQFILVALVLATCPARSALVLLRLLIIGFYFESAVTKLDYSFLHTLGQQFLEALANLAGGTVAAWSPRTRLAAAAVFPVGELLVAVGLMWGRTRRVALWASISLHVLLLLILGPLGLNHKPGVLAWNLYFIVQNLVLFWTPRRVAAPYASVDSTERAPWPAVALIAAALTLPLVEPWGWFDTWPSWGLYASSAERVVLQIHRHGRAQLPASLELYLETPSDPNDPWLRLRLDRWALETLGAPIYPQNRVQLGVARAVAVGDLAERARAIRLSRADRWTGERTSTILQGPAQWDAASGEYFFNTQPRRSTP